MKTTQRNNASQEYVVYSTMIISAGNHRERYFVWRRYKVSRRLHWINKYKLAKGCDVCGYGPIQHGCQAVFPKGLDWAHLDPLSKNMCLSENKESMYYLVIKVSKNPVKNRQYRREIFKELRKCRLLCKLDHIAESDERDESITGHALSTIRKNEPIEMKEIIRLDTTQEDMFYDREEQTMG